MKEASALNRLEEAFRSARSEGRAALIPYVTAGFPSLTQLPRMIAALGRAGADIIEIGLPFSDPLADGPVLQKAATAALARGTKIRDILEVVGTVSASSPPLVFLTYINPVFHYGIESFARDARHAGVEGLIIPDLPWVEGKGMRHAAESSGMALIPLVAPTSTDAHLQAITQARGFVYGVSVTGVTGARQTVDGGVASLVQRVKREVDLPVAIGFGISTPTQAREVGSVADGVIVGSALVHQIDQHPDHAEDVAYEFVAALRAALSETARKA